MIRKFLIAFACLTLSACALGGNLAADTASDIAANNLALTSADEKLFDTLSSAVTVAADSAALLGTTGLVKPGSSDALALAGLLDDTRDAVNRAYAVWRGTVTGDRSAAMAEVNVAFTKLTAALIKWRKP